MLVYYFFRLLLVIVTFAHNSVTVQNGTHVYMNFFHHKDLGNHLLQLWHKVVKHPIYTYIFTDLSSAQVGLNVEFIMKRAKLDALFLSVYTG
jgi:hypothetical protein